MVPFLMGNMPRGINMFYDLFAGGFNVGINAKCERVIYNDINFKVRELLEYITHADMPAFYKIDFVILRIIKYVLAFCYARV